MLYYFNGVYILPLRNENMERTDFEEFLKEGLYPTFKEWKQENLEKN